jgi:hypothetical protein
MVDFYECIVNSLDLDNGIINILVNRMLLADFCMIRNRIFHFVGSSGYSPERILELIRICRIAKVMLEAILSCFMLYHTPYVITHLYYLFLLFLKHSFTFLLLDHIVSQLFVMIIANQ